MRVPFELLNNAPTFHGKLQFRSSARLTSPPNFPSDALQDVAALRPRLVSELPVFGSEMRDGEEILLSGQADAVAFDETGAIDVVVDWKSDVAPEPSSIGHYRQQIGDYRTQTKATRALLVFMTTGQVIDVK
jgi:ATP-dependent exoDNAse (exonuclease V) beta subunit